MPSPGLYESGGGKPTDNENVLCKMMLADGYTYTVDSSTNARTICRMNCQERGCSVQTKIVRGNKSLAKYQRGEHNHARPTGAVASHSLVARKPAPPPASHRSEPASARSFKPAPPAASHRSEPASARSRKPAPPAASRHSESASARSRKPSPPAASWPCHSESPIIIMQTEYDIQQYHFPFSREVCKCTIKAWKDGRPNKTMCSEHGQQIEGRLCRRGKFNIEGVGQRIALLIDSYFVNKGRIPDP